MTKRGKRGRISRLPSDVVQCQDGRVCTGETACHQNHNGTYVCICYHTGKPPENGVCRRITVKHPVDASHNQSRAIHVQISDDMRAQKVLTLRAPGREIRDGLDPISQFTILISVISITGFILIFGVIALFKRKFRRKSSRSSTDRGKSGNEHLETLGTGHIFPLQNFVFNPTYEVTPLLESGIPVFLSSEIQILKQIGQGCFGKVFRGELKSGEAVAVKIMKREHAGEALKEVETMSGFTHDNILKMIGIASNQGDDSPWLLFEFMEYGDLATLLRTLTVESGQNKVPSEVETSLPVLTTDDLMDVASQIAEGMNYLSSQHFVHRDLAARNCLVGRDGKVKVSDFGLSRDVYTCDYYKIGGSRLLPVRWMSPESVLYGRFTLESDVWAYGVLLWEIYTWGKQPYYGHSNEEVVKLIIDGVLLSPPSNCPPFICGLMAGCWKSDPKDRFRFSLIKERFMRRLKETRMGQGDEVSDEYEIPDRKVKLEYVEVI